MVIKVGSQNPTKVKAVEDALKLYPQLFPEAAVIGVKASSEFDHPKNLEQTVAGAMERAKKVFSECAYSFGLEGGLIEVPQSQSGFMEVGVCAIYNGKNIHLGLSPAFEWPPRVTDLIVSGQADASQAFKQLGLTEHDKLGAQPGGIVGFLTGGRLTREDFTKHSILMAMIQLERPELYRQ